MISTSASGRVSIAGATDCRMDDCRKDCTRLSNWNRWSAVLD